MPTSGFFAQDVVKLARALIGMRLTVDGVGDVIVETEAYDAADPGSHSFIGPTNRNRSMFGPTGRAYVYRIYGAHWCLNIVGGTAAGAAVLVRALEPTQGIAAMSARRGVDDIRKLCSGPGKLCQALAVTDALDGAPLHRPPFDLAPHTQDVPIAYGPRIGITKAADTPWRFGWRGSSYLSRPITAG